MGDERRHDTRKGELPEIKVVRGGEGTARLAARGGGAEDEEYRAAPRSEKENFQEWIESGKRGTSATSTATSSP